MPFFGFAVSRLLQRIYLQPASPDLISNQDKQKYNGKEGKAMPGIIKNFDFCHWEESNNKDLQKSKSRFNF